MFITGSGNSRVKMVSLKEGLLEILDFYDPFKLQYPVGMHCIPDEHLLVLGEDG